jgi:hypothetical protein
LPEDNYSKQNRGYRVEEHILNFMPFSFQNLKSEEAFIHKNLTCTFFEVYFNFNFIIIIVTESLWSLASSNASYSLPYILPSSSKSSLQEF